MRADALFKAIFHVTSFPVC